VVEHTRREIAKILKSYTFSIKKSLIFFLLSLIFALFFAYYPDYVGMNEASRATLFILLFSLGLWISEAIPAFAVSLLLVGLEIVILGKPNGVFATTPHQWKMFIEPWSSSLIFLFLSGFILASGVAKTQLDQYIAQKVLLLSGDKPSAILFAIMGVTFIFSMFVSNTATTVMMLTVLLPIIKNLKEKNPFSKALLLGVAVSANLGGMGTIIGTPPNAIAVGALGDKAPDFLTWMFYAVPPATLLMIIFAFVLMKLYPSSEKTLNIAITIDEKHHITLFEKFVVMGTFTITLLLWLTSSLHHMPTAVVAFLPIVVFTVTGVIDSEDIRKLPWDVLFLIMGGLSLGLAVSQTGLAEYIARQLPFENMQPFALVLTFSYLIVVVSNFMSNTAAANILIPIIIALVSSLFPQVTSLLILGAVIIALSSSNAMLLPVSTPPNALVYSTKGLSSKDFLLIGVLVGALGPLIVIEWLNFIVGVN
jgi:sodium-dependent dicarboxylate transporter 2/3/5